MSEVNEIRFLVKHEQVECKCGFNKSACNSKQEWDHDPYSCKNDQIWNPSMCDCECCKTCKTDEYLDIKNCSCKKRLFGKLELVCDDEILNTTETSLDDKKSNM